MKELINQINTSEFELTFCEKFDEKSSHWNLTKHKHNAIEILYFLEGNADILISEEKMHVSLFNMIVYPKNQFHQESLDMNRHQEVICMIINSSQFDLPHSSNIADTDGKLLGLMDLILSEYKRESSSQYIIDHLIKALCMLIVDKASDVDHHGLVLCLSI